MSGSILRLRSSGVAWTFRFLAWYGDPVRSLSRHRRFTSDRSIPRNLLMDALPYSALCISKTFSPSSGVCLLYTYENSESFVQLSGFTSFLVGFFLSRMDARQRAHEVSLKKHSYSLIFRSAARRRLSGIREISGSTPVDTASTYTAASRRRSVSASGTSFKECTL